MTDIQLQRRECRLLVDQSHRSLCFLRHCRLTLRIRRCKIATNKFKLSKQLQPNDQANSAVLKPTCGPNIKLPDSNHKPKRTVLRKVKLAVGLLNLFNSLRRQCRQNRLKDKCKLKPLISIK